jgi:hypothetical protein
MIFNLSYGDVAILLIFTLLSPAFPGVVIYFKEKIEIRRLFLRLYIVLVGAWLGIMVLVDSHFSHVSDHTPLHRAICETAVTAQSLLGLAAIFCFLWIKQRRHPPIR